MTLLCEMTSEGHTSRGKTTPETANAGEILTEGALVCFVLLLSSHSLFSLSFFSPFPSPYSFTPSLLHSFSSPIQSPTLPHPHLSTTPSSVATLLFSLPLPHNATTIMIYLSHTVSSLLLPPPPPLPQILLLLQL